MHPQRRRRRTLRPSSRAEHLDAAALQLALRLSSGVAVVLLFGAGFKLARYSGLRPFRTGAARVGIGVALVAIAIALGG